MAEPHPPVPASGAAPGGNDSDAGGDRLPPPASAPPADWPPAQPSAPTSPGGWLVSWGFALAVLGYFALQVVLRSLSAGNLGLDEAEQLVMAQTWQAGYGPQPPLYTWLFLALKPLTGESVLSLALLKFGLLAVALLATFRLCRQLFGQPLVAAVAALTILYLPQVAWESQRALTHSVIALAAVALATTLFVDLVTRRRSRDYWLFGLALAACALSKHNAVFLPFGLLLAGLLLPASRPALLDRRLAGALGLALLLVLPNLVWMAFNGEAALARSGKLAMEPETGLLDSLSAIGRALISFALLPTLLLALIALLPSSGPRLPAAPDPRLRRLLTLALALAALTVMLLVIGASADRMKDRWLTPLLFPAVPVAFAWLAPRLTRRRLRLAAAAAGVIALGSMAALWTRQLLPAGWAEAPNMEAPFHVLAPSLPAEGTLLAASNWVAGNLRLHRPGLAAVTPEYRGAGQDPPARPLVLVWQARSGETVPPALRALAGELLGAELPADLPVTALSTPYPGGAPQLDLRVARLD